MLLYLKFILFSLFITTSLLAENVDFINPTTTPGGTPNLSSDDTLRAYNSQITTDSSGKYVYTTWEKWSASEAKYRVQVARSEDYGVTWKYPQETQGAP